MPLSAPSPLSVQRDDLEHHVAEAWPSPGAGDTRTRWNLLSALGRLDLPLAKVVEPHHDAVAILTELGGPQPPAGSIWAVWAAEPPFARLEASSHHDGWEVSGHKAFCSGAGVVTHALVTAEMDGTSGLFAIDVRSAGIDEAADAPSWSGHGMHRADTRTLQLTDVPATQVGEPGDYVDRPGFWHGAIGIAACWDGGARGVADTLEQAAQRLGPHALAHLGAVRADLDALAMVLDRAATAIDDGTASDPERLALTVRSLAADVTERVVARVGRALGPGPLAFDAGHADRVADLQVFVRQHHAERDLERLGSLGAR